MRGNFTTDRSGDNNPNYKHGLRHSRLFSIWSNMITRCYNKHSPTYRNYGGRGIKICDEWDNDFKSFHDWAMLNGYDDSLTLDRINFDGNYEPSNCRWTTIEVQSNNRRNNHYVTINNVTMTLKQWSVKYGINYKTLRDRLLRGWDIEKALITPVQKIRR